MRSRFLSVAAILAISVSFGSTLARAGTLAVDFTSSPNNFGPSTWNLGYEFSVNNSVTATGLGNLDYGSVGNLPQPQQVGLWDSSGDLLASAFVNAGSTQLGEWAFTSIAPVTLHAGNTYIVGGQGGADYAGEVPISVDPDITYDEDLYTDNGGANSPLVEPLTSEGLNSASSAGWFGGNVEFSTAVPEPASITLFGGALAAFGAIRRRNRKRA